TQETQVRYHGAAAQRQHFVGQLRREVLSVAAFLDSVLRLSQRAARDVKERFHLPVLELIEALRLIAACGPDRVTKIGGEPRIPRGPRALVGVSKEQLSKLIRQLPANQFGVALDVRHARGITRSVPIAF